MIVQDCRFRLRYPLWHTSRARLAGCTTRDTCRAAMWCDRGLELEDCDLGGIKVLRECGNVMLRRCRIASQEFGWFCRDVVMEDCDLAFEFSDVQATVQGRIDSVKNPLSGRIQAGDIGEIILDENQRAEIPCRIVSGYRRCG